jgi:VIT1/CCC1 family predicted Fe2+/Mn2+ transporter
MLCKYVVIIVLWFTGLLYSLRVGNRVIIRSISMVLGLGILIFIPYLAGLVSSSVGYDNPIVTFGVSSRQKVW